MPYDRLANLKALRPAGTVERASSSTARDNVERLARLLEAERRSTPFGAHLLVRRSHARPAPPRFGTGALRLLHPSFPEELADPSAWIYFDTETTGLAGGTGTCAFLIGLAWWDGEEFVLEQLFMSDYRDERSVLHDAARRLAERPVWVSFNGKSFDGPLLETRFRMARHADIPAPRVHLDLLHPARQLWRSRLSSVALTQLEKHVLCMDRDGDIPSETIPQRYFDFLRGAPPEPITEVFRHNAMDLLGLEALARRLLSILENPAGGASEGHEMYGVSRMLNRRGDRDLAGRVCEEALQRGLPESLEPAARRELALLSRRRGDYERANRLWEALLDHPAYAPEAYEQLAIHFEHRERDAPRAAELVRDALLLLIRESRNGRIPMPRMRRWHARFQHRLRRLNARIGSSPPPGTEP